MRIIEVTVAYFIVKREINVHLYLTKHKEPTFFSCAAVSQSFPLKIVTNKVKYPSYAINKHSMTIL